MKFWLESLLIKNLLPVKFMLIEEKSFLARFSNNKSDPLLNSIKTFFKDKVSPRHSGKCKIMLNEDSFNIIFSIFKIRFWPDILIKYENLVVDSESNSK